MIVNSADAQRRSRRVWLNAKLDVQEVIDAASRLSSLMATASKGIPTLIDRDAVSRNCESLEQKSTRKHLLMVVAQLIELEVLSRDAAAQIRIRFEGTSLALDEADGDDVVFGIEGAAR